MKNCLMTACVAMIMLCKPAHADECIKPQAAGYKTVACLSDGLAKVKKDDKYGFIDARGNVVIVPQYRYADNFNQGIARVSLDYAHDGIIDKKGSVLLPLQYDRIADFEEELAMVEKDNKYGFVNKQGKIVIPLQYDANYDEVIYFDEGLATVFVKDKGYGSIDKTGKVVIPLQYDESYGFSEGLAKVKKDDKYGFIDKTGKIVIPFSYEYETGDYFSNGLTSVTVKDKIGFIDKMGKVVIPPIYDISEESPYFSLHHTGEQNFSGTGVFKNNLAVMIKDEKFGMIDKNGVAIIDFKYDYLYPFNPHGKAAAAKNNQCGVIDKSEKTIIPFAYQDCYQFNDGLIVLKDNHNKWQIVASDGSVKKTDYDDIAIPKDPNYFSWVFPFGTLVQKDNKFGFIDGITGKVVIPLEYDNVHSGDYSAWLKKGDDVFSFDMETGEMDPEDQ